MSSDERNVIITGIAGRLGRLVAQYLHREPGIHVIGVDRRPFPGKPKDIEVHHIDIRSKRARDVFRHKKISALIHMGLMHSRRVPPRELYSWNIGGTAKLLEYCQSYAIPKVVVLSSANVYGPRPENTQFLTEEAPLLGAQSFANMRDLVEIDHLASSFFWRARDIDTVILRPVHILGQVRNAPSNYLRIERPPVLLGFDPMIQIIHEEDVAHAIACALRPGVRGIYNVVGPGELPLSTIIGELGKKPVRIPHPLAKPLWNLAWRVGYSSFPSAEFDFIRYVCMVDGKRATAELDFHPRYSLTETIHAVEQRS